MDDSALIDVISSTVRSALAERDTQTAVAIQELRSEIKALHESFDEQAAKTELHDKMLRGNGEKGLKERMNLVEQLVTEDHSALFGDKDNEGLITRMKHNENEHGWAKKPLWIIASTIFGVFGTWLAGLIFSPK